MEKENPKGLVARKSFIVKSCTKKQLLETLETNDGNENGLYIIQKTNAHTFPAQWAFNIRQAD